MISNRCIELAPQYSKTLKICHQNLAETKHAEKYLVYCFNENTYREDKG